MRLLPALMLLIGTLLFVDGCHPENYDDLVPATLREINQIRDDDDLTPQEQRTGLAELGIDPSTVNALLQDERLANQYGGDLRTAYAKVTAPDFIRLTPDEIQVYGDEASNVDPEAGASLSDEEAQAIATFFDTNDLSSSEELEAFLDNPDNEVPSTITAGVLRSLFVDFDPSLLLPSLP